MSTQFGLEVAWIGLFTNDIRFHDLNAPKILENSSAAHATFGDHKVDADASHLYKGVCRALLYDSSKDQWGFRAVSRYTQR